MTSDSNNDGYLPVSELCRRFGLTDRSVKKHLAAAGTRVRSTSRKQASGQVAKVYLEADFDAWLKTRGTYTQPRPKKTALPAAMAATVMAADDAEALAGGGEVKKKDNPADSEFIESNFPDLADPEKQEIREALQSIRTDDLFGLIERLRSTEKQQYQLYQAAIKSSEMDEGATTQRLKNYQDAAKAVRQMEAELPEILAARERYIDSRIIIPLLKNSANKLRLTLMNIGAILSEECAWKSTEEIRAAFDRRLAAAVNDFAKEMKLK